MWWIRKKREGKIKRQLLREESGITLTFELVLYFKLYVLIGENFTFCFNNLETQSSLLGGVNYVFQSIFWLCEKKMFRAAKLAPETLKMFQKCYTPKQICVHTNKTSHHAFSESWHHHAVQPIVYHEQWFEL
jgi:hypothetical protein